MYQFEFTGRCPSKAQIVKQLKIGLKNNDWVEVSWGENRIIVERNRYYNPSSPFYGSGWIRSNGGYDIAKELSE